MTWRGFYVERADPDVKGYEIGSISRNNLINRYKWVKTNNMTNIELTAQFHKMREFLERKCLENRG